jgi:hypothetical protein
VFPPNVGKTDENTQIADLGAPFAAKSAKTFNQQT